MYSVCTRNRQGLIVEYESKEDPLPQIMLEKFSGEVHYKDEEIEVSLKMNKGRVQDVALNSIEGTQIECMDL